MKYAVVDKSRILECSVNEHGQINFSWPAWPFESYHRAWAAKIQAQMTEPDGIWEIVSFV